MTNHLEAPYVEPHFDIFRQREKSHSMATKIPLHSGYD